MPSQKGKRVAIGVSILGVLAIAIPSILFRRDISEKWYIRKLEVGGAGEKRAAVEKLGQMRSERAIPAFMKALDEADEDLQRAIVTASKAIGIEAVPVVFRVLGKNEGNFDQNKFEMMQFAAKTLTEMGPARDVGEKSHNPMLRQWYARALGEEGRLQEALDEYLWCYDHGNENYIGYFGVRVSFLLNEIVEIGDRFPQARKAIEERRDRLEDKVLEEAASTNWLKRIFTGVRVVRGYELALLNDHLKEPERTLSVFRKLKDLKGGSATRQMMLHSLMDRLLQDHLYSEIVDAAGDIQAIISQRITGTIRLLAKIPNEAEALIRKNMIEEGGKYYEALVGAEHFKRAAAIAKQLIDFAPYGETYATLVRRALLAGKAEQAKELLEQASKALSESELQIVKDAEAHLEQVPPEEP